MSFKGVICKIWCFFVVLIFLFGCKMDRSTNKKVELTMVNGHYMVDKAYRNGQLTTSLDNGFYEITGDTIKTNLTKTLDTLSTKVNLNNQNLVHIDKNVMDFHVSKMTSDTIILDTKIRNFKFDIILLKSE